MKPDILARVTLYRTEQGGRRRPTPSSRFGCLFQVDGEYFDCRLLLDKSGPLNPGQTAVVAVKFLSPQLLKGHLRRSKPFKLWENKPIASGKVTKILEPATS
ncbi:MAG: hypothetical protein HYR86_12040 [Candidatus Rokubacteria bacterium]|nr:hypothetical protein [Candidatus Rokubacteria bacterium]